MRAIVEYDGAAYAGFQLQATRPSVQGALEEAVRSATGTTTRVVGAGRTDAGAHALGQVVAFTTDTSLDDRTLLRALNAHLPSDVAIREVSTVSDDFHPRFDAKSRHYCYVILNSPVASPLWRGRALHVRQPLDVEAMRCAAAYLVGHHDFAAFGRPETSSASLASGRTRSTVRELETVTVEHDGDRIVVHFVGNAFMKHMIRSIVGTLLLVGAARISPAEFAAIMRSGDRRMAGPTVPAHGLYLLEVTY